MAKKSLDDITFEDLHEVGLHNFLERPVKFRIEFEIARRLEALASDEARLQLVRGLEMSEYTHPETGYREDLGLELQWEKLDGIYIPTLWLKYMKDKKRPWNLSFIGILSNDEIMMMPQGMSQEEMAVFNKTILELPSTSQLYFFIFYSEWRKNVMRYARARLNFYAQDFLAENSKFVDKDETRKYEMYAALIKPLIERYRTEMKNG